jgi:uncharacterized membrane protein
MSRRNHFIVLTALVALIAVILYYKVDMDKGWYWLIPYFFGAMGWIFIYAASKSQ